MQRRPHLFWLVQIIPCCFLIPVASVQAQIVSDDTLPTNSIVPPNCTVCTIEGGTVKGGNLFHSFHEFSIPTNGSAFFNNDPDIQNIFSRVTGGLISNLDGVLKANGTANLFLLNPNGIVFGSNASLDIGGSFVASTANSLKFSDGSEFSANNTSTSPLLSVTVPVGLQFGDAVGRIVNRSQFISNEDIENGENPTGLELQPSRTLALVGGEVRLEGGNLTAPGGRIEVGSFGSNSLVNLNSTNQELTLSYEGVQSFQDIHLSQGAVIDVTDQSSFVGSGDIQIQGRRVTLTDGSQISSATFGSISAGTVSVTASESVELLGTSANGISSNLNTVTIGDGDAGSLRITTRRLILQDGGLISTSSVFLPPFQNSSSVKGGSGNLTINASESVEISDRSPVTGISGSITVESLTNGDPGELNINTGRLILRDGGRISAATSGAGQRGTLTINASESVDVIGTGTDVNGQVAPSTLEVSSTGTGNAGNLTVTTDNLRLQDGAEITASSTQAGGGNINITAEDIRLRNSSLISSSVFESVGGGGNIAINSDIFIALEDSDILANAFDGRGGDIQIVSPVFLADLFSSGNATAVGRNPGSFEPFRGNDRVDISVAALGSGDTGSLSVSFQSLDQNSLSSLSDNFVPPEQVIADSCLTHRHKEQGSFIVTGTGGLPNNPYNPMNGQYSVTQVQGITASSEQLTIPNPPSPTPNSWQPGNPIQEAEGMTVTADGRIMVGKAPALIAANGAEELICSYSTPNVK
ncbi:MULTISPECIES: filamentous hemagglutinin N-terminal domain-containing protein [unclassified Coleofasciculus]|uniref:two-partner secretion domain-containing protein n=1 Tax=unclassified Coleofasciculus TaxID=2692782 RepID=UPI00187FCD41|nr:MULTISPECIES: filamentous hemagglutinin N-terminal domain-containing protein [unclassified Coleofasciculus]MBE9129076.1 filamentous hemagglutinin N-terminal domain-containing protein [Coleofasciculus sp. LEGE 07081]MBE9151883.1 filamentous hemagglutinin N-terminal domain-containing protein [Coleofasciculus sp. LEGE 07092]